MVGTAAHPGPYDPLENARPDEPVFTLAGRDPDAPATITFWAHQRRNRAIRAWGDSKRKADQQLLEAELKQCAEADDTAMLFTEWRRNEVPVEESTGRATYTEVKKTEEQLAAANAAKALGDNIRHLRETAYHMCEAKDGLAALGAIPPEVVERLEADLKYINLLADLVAPQRERPSDDE